MSPPTRVRKDTLTKFLTMTAEYVDTRQLASPATVREPGHSHVSLWDADIEPVSVSSPNLPVLALYWYSFRHEL